MESEKTKKLNDQDTDKVTGGIIGGTRLYYGSLPKEVALNSYSCPKCQMVLTNKGCRTSGKTKWKYYCPNCDVHYILVTRQGNKYWYRFDKGQKLPF